MSLTMVNPQLNFIKKEVERILSLVDLESNGQRLNVDGFRLRDLSDWQNSFVPNAFEAIGSLSGRCNANCIFCPERTLPFDRDLSFIDRKEAATRLNYYSPLKQRGLFPSSRPYMEQLIHPHAMDIIKKAREKSPEELFILTTNGSMLDARTIKELSSIKPVFIKLSVNSTDPAIRKKITGLSIPSDGCREIMGLLNGAEIPFTGSIVAWPDIPRGKMESSIRDIARYNPYGIRMRLPLIHRFTPGIKRLNGNLNWNRFWETTSDWVEDIKNDIRVPLWIEPVQYGRIPLIPKIDGVIRNSPAEKAGLRCGDEIVSFNGKPMFTRSSIREWIHSGAGDGSERIEVVFRRSGNEHTRTLCLSGSDRYPFDPRLSHPGERFGMLFLPDFDLDHIIQVINIIEKYKAANTLFFCSPLSAATLSMLINHNACYKQFFESRELWLYTMEAAGLGGNFALMESRFVADYEAGYDDFISSVKDKPDLILVPNYFANVWGSDLTGQSIYQLQYKTGIPVERIAWHFVYGKED